MSTKIRQGVFETNSSSTHSICIAKDAKLSIPKSLHFDFGEFGWEYDTLDSVEQKASYLYTGLYHNRREADAKKIVEMLTEKGIKIFVEEPTYRGDIGSQYFDSGYVDHGDELNEFLDDICTDENKLLRFLFSDFSFIITGNDNADHDVAIKVDYPYDSYYKGN